MQLMQYKEKFRAVEAYIMYRELKLITIFTLRNLVEESKLSSKQIESMTHKMREKL